ncbi:ABC transporter permease [Treponema phagedenis]|uniref:ABC transporter permease n=1 Tax=Treponema phagedenis TaxID=162 RepID=A0AAE6M8R2_TREPH|nr:ABC transporter permease [Treponema phagedenis]NVP23596.1 ABC transporter permease [Treponema phagedenis]QEJ98729.1 ABC transporter permease [Treponema phagedenis]QEK04234.1 ABC transporter permease [Treponema phagedenis]QEK09849.1 ABC transporter permease [Treponema phagedenis]QLC58427.1 ABC transporter permease [Treponema phagedenis]
MIKEQSKLKTSLKKVTGKQGFKGFASVLIAILIGIFVGFFIMLITNPGQSFEGLGVLLQGFATDAAGTTTGFGKMLHISMPIIFTGLAIAFSYQSGLFNIGASGQFTMGIMMATVIGLKGGSLGGAQWLVAIILSMIVGFIWGAIPGILKAQFNVNEVITGIMLNYIGMYLTNSIISIKNGFVDTRQNATYYIPKQALTPSLGLDKAFPYSGLNMGFIIALVAIAIVWLVLNKTVFGYELKNVGANKNAAKYAGIKEKRKVIFTVAISGMLAALGGALYMLSAGTYVGSTRYTPDSVIRQEGFNGIAVAFLALNNPIGILFTSLFMSSLTIAGDQLQHTGYSKEIITVITAAILYISAFSATIGKFLIGLIEKRRETYKERLEIVASKSDLKSKESILYLEQTLNKKVFKTTDLEKLSSIEEEKLLKKLNRFIKFNDFPEEYDVERLETVLKERIASKNFKDYPEDILQISTYNLLAKLEKENYRKRNLIEERQIDLEEASELETITALFNEKVFGEKDPETLKSLTQEELNGKIEGFLNTGNIPYELDKERVKELLTSYIKLPEKDFINYDKEILKLTYPEMGVELHQRKRNEKIRLFFNRFKIQVRKEKEGEE